MMSSIQEKKLQKIVIDMGILANEIGELISEQKVRKRIRDIQMDPSIGKSEEELDNYLRKRGVKVARMGN